MAPVDLLLAQSSLMPEAAATGKYDTPGCAFTLDYKAGKILEAHGEVQAVLGISQDDFMQRGIKYLIDNTHPLDSKRMKKYLLYATVKSAMAYLRGQPEPGPYRVGYRLQHGPDNYQHIDSVTYFLDYQATGIPKRGLATLYNVTAMYRDNAELQAWSHLHLVSLERAAIEGTENVVAAFRERNKLPAGQPIELTMLDEPVRDLSTRELEILKLLASGNNTKDIAKKLSLTANTIEGYRKTLLKKFGARNVAHLVQVASRSYWLG